MNAGYGMQVGLLRPISNGGYNFLAEHFFPIAFYPLTGNGIHDRFCFQLPLRHRLRKPDSTEVNPTDEERLQGNTKPKVAQSGAVKSSGLVVQALYGRLYVGGYHQQKE